jgi:hypothetical protein
MYLLWCGVVTADSEFEVWSSRTQWIIYWLTADVLGLDYLCEVICAGGSW